MTDFREFSITAERIRIVEATGRIGLDTDAPALRVAPDYMVSISGLTIDFPDLWKGVYYWQSADTIVVAGSSINRYACNSFAAPVGQEWGPDKPSPCTLPDIVLGPAPAGWNYLDVFVNLTQTMVPAATAADVPGQNWHPEGDWVRLEGGSCEIEGYGYLRRLFDIRLDGGNIVLRRRQSVNDDDGTIERLSTSVATGDRLYFIAGTNAGYSAGHYAHMGAWIEGKGIGNTNTYKPGDSNSCALTADGVSYASQWTGDIIILPGRAS